MKLSATSSARHRSGESGAFLKEMIMKTVGNELKVGGDSGQEEKLSLKSQLLVIAAVVGLGGVIIGGAQWTHPDAGAAQGAEQTEGDASAAPAAFEYFPAQYVNQGKEIEEHIQAF
jgi:hypothetical protein